jgi:hypothetical protein
MAAVNPNDPRAKTPVAGQPGHFDHHEWIKESLMLLEARLAQVEGVTAELPTDPATDRIDFSSVTPSDALGRVNILVAYLDEHGTVIQ